MVRLFACIALLALIRPAAAEDFYYTFSGVVQGYDIPPDTIATANGTLIFNQTGNDLQAEALGPSVIGAPGLTIFNPEGIIDSNSWDVSPYGEILSGLLEVGDPDEGGMTAYLRVDQGDSFGQISYYLDGTIPESFSGSITITPEYPVPEPAGLSIFAVGLVGLGLMRRYIESRVTITAIGCV